jgi:flagellar hook-associated protein 1 FlgK
LAEVASAAQGVAQHVNAVSAHLEGVRTQADHQIAAQVETLNTSLSHIEKLNKEIVAQRSSGHDAAALMDLRQTLVDKVAEIVPVRKVARDNDQIALFTTGGASLLEGRAAQIGFAPQALVTADMTLSSGALSGLTLNGTPIASTDDGLMGGGALGAAFAIRDKLAPDAQTQIDAFARDLIARFSGPGVDPTLAPGQSGLFIDSLALPDEVGLAGRLGINPDVDPDRGGALWKLRDGMNAPAPGPVGDPSLLMAFQAALNAPERPVSGAFAGLPRTTSGLATDILSRVSGARQDAEAQQSFATARQDALTTAFLAGGVDTDQELQKLLQIEQAYAANARVIKTVDEMIQQLLRL